MGESLKTCGHESPNTFQIRLIAGKLKVTAVQCQLPKDHQINTPHKFEMEWPR